MGHALAHDLVERVEVAVCPEDRTLGGANAPARVQEGREQLGGQLGQGPVMGPRDDEGMAVEDRQVVQERHELVLLEHKVCRQLTARHLVEDAGFRGAEVTLSCRMAEIPLGQAPPETVLPPASPEAEAALREASEAEPGQRRQRLAAVASQWPRDSAAWAALAELTEHSDPVGAYAFARTGYHRGLDALRAAGWRGSGYVRWRHPSNRGFLRSLDALRRLAGSIGEAEEEQRCAMFLRQLDPDWPPREL